jgi:ribosome biogenesis GTPase / thiamine phosphate phosphatase
VNLYDLGWDASFADAFEPYERDGVIPARVAARHHGPCELLSELGRLGGLPAGRLRDEELPAVGDWVVARRLVGERKAVIEAVLPRRSAFARKEAWRRSVEQVVAANVDTVFVVTAFGFDLNPRRLERYLTAAWDSGASPAIVVNQRDMVVDASADLAVVESVALGVPMHAVSAATGDGLDALARHLGRGRTVALLGSSGVGKSTLVNRLAGRDVLATAETSAGGRGRHTTSHRELVPLPTGALLLDTPGMRELQLWADGEALDTAFEDVAELAQHCRFSDCSHEHEPACAVQAALGEGSLSGDRLASYRKLQRELRALEVRKDARLRAEARKDARRLNRAYRSGKRQAGRNR